jgi:hypothetical protein
MKPEELTADEILRRTLLEVRAAGTRRRNLKMALGSVVVLLVVFLLIPRPGPAGGPERVAVVVSDEVPRLYPVPEEKIAVMVWRGGTPCLEWVELHDLGPLELEFSLAPVIAFADEGT